MILLLLKIFAEIMKSRFPMEKSFITLRKKKAQKKALHS